MQSKNIDKISTLQVSLEARGHISWYRSIELDKLNNFCCICLYKIFTRKKLLISTFLDIKSTCQASHGARGLISWYHSIELDKVNNFCSICLYKIFTSKKLLPSTNIDKISNLQASHEARGAFSWYNSIELDKVNNFCYICLYKIFKIKKLWCKTFLKIRWHGGSIFESRWTSMSFDLDQWNSHHKRRYNRWKFQLNIFNGI